MRKALQLKEFESVDGIVNVESDVDNTFQTAQFIKGNVKVRFNKLPESFADEIWMMN